MKNRKYYRNRFADYPDVLTVPQFCKLMGGHLRQDCPEADP